MTLEQLLRDLRIDRLDDLAEPPMWSDETLTGHLNDAVRQMCLRQRALVEAVNPKICSYTLAPGQRLVKLHPSILSVHTVRLTDPNDTNYRHSMRGITTSRMRRWRHDWESSRDARPDYWMPDYQEGYLALSNGTDRAGVLQLTCWRMPLEEELLDVNDMDAAPVIGEAFHKDLIDWAAYKAFSSPDSDLADSARASEARAMFDAKVGSLPTATEIRLWGVSKIVGTTPQYI